MTISGNRAPPPAVALDSHNYVSRGGGKRTNLFPPPPPSHNHSFNAVLINSNVNNNNVNGTPNSKISHEMNKSGQVYKSQPQAGLDGNHNAVYQINNGPYLNLPYSSSPYRLVSCSTGYSEYTKAPCSSKS